MYICNEAEQGNYMNDECSHFWVHTAIDRCFNLSHKGKHCPRKIDTYCIKIKSEKETR